MYVELIRDQCLLSILTGNELFTGVIQIFK